MPTNNAVLCQIRRNQQKVEIDLLKPHQQEFINGEIRRLESEKKQNQRAMQQGLEPPNPKPLCISSLIQQFKLENDVEHHRNAFATLFWCWRKNLFAVVCNFFRESMESNEATTSIIFTESKQHGWHQWLSRWWFGRFRWLFRRKQHGWHQWLSRWWLGRFRWLFPRLLRREWE